MTAQDLFDQIQQLIQDELAKIDKQTMQNYMARRKAITEAARTVYDSATIRAHLDPTIGNTIYVSKAEAFKYGRMDKLNDLVTEQAKLAGLTDISNLEKGGVKLYETGYDGYAWAYSQGYGLPITGGAKVRLVAEALYSNFYGAVFDQTVKRNLANWPDDIISTMTRELNQGKGFGSIAGKIAESTNRQYWQALRVAKTEGGRIASQASLDSLALLDEVGAEYGKLWVHKVEAASKSYTPREDHIDMDGEPADANGIFHLPSGATGPEPRMTGNAADDINCSCFAVAVIAGERPTERRVKDAGIIPYETYREREARGGSIPIREVRNARRNIK
jgi:hypothetical protein